MVHNAGVWVVEASLVSRSSDALTSDFVNPIDGGQRWALDTGLTTPFSSRPSFMGSI